MSIEFNGYHCHATILVKEISCEATIKTTPSNGKIVRISIKDYHPSVVLM